jgi:crotonobetainyl-CoA:carnitine CoA-transferase CaiB-like acyl-CoA transferase
LALSIESDRQWAALGIALGHPRWIADTRFSTADGRHAHHDEIDDHLAAALESLDRDAAVEMIWSAGIPVALVDVPRAVTSNEQMLARQFFTPLHHAVAGELLYPGFAARWADRERPLHRGPPPLLGEHNAEVLGTLLGLGAPELERLESDFIIGTRPIDTAPARPPTARL